MSDFNTFNTPAVGDNTAPAAPAAPVAQPTTQVAPQTQTPATPATPAEDRSNWVPPYRLREQNARHEAALQAERQRFTSEQAALQRKLEILAGVTAPENPQIDEVKKQFGQVFPELAELAAQAAEIKQLLAQREELTHSKDHYWTRYNRDAMNTLYSEAEKTYGQPLNDDAKRQLGSSFIGYLQSNPGEYERYQEDPSVVKEYWKSFSDRFIDPVRRSATAQTIGRIPTALPQDTPSGTVNFGTPVPKPANQDERMALALARYKEVSKTGFGE